jgi:hypothetical protein
MTVRTTSFRRCIGFVTDGEMIPVTRTVAFVAACLFGLFAASSARAQHPADAPLETLRTSSLAKRDLVTPPTQPITYGLRLEMAMLRGSRWSPAAILDGVKRAAPILAQCGIRIEAARLHEFAGPGRYRYLWTPDSREFARRVGLRKPAIYFVDDTRMNPAFEAEAIGRGNAGKRPEMIDTVWITLETRDLPIVLAHELVHVLANSGDHSSLPRNLMRDQTTPFNTRLAPEQCSAIVSTAQENGLLDRLPGADEARRGPKVSGRVSDGAPRAYSGIPNTGTSSRK